MSNHAKEQGIPQDVAVAAVEGRCQRELETSVVAAAVRCGVVRIKGHLAGDAAQSQIAHEGM